MGALDSARALKATQNIPEDWPDFTFTTTHTTYAQQILAERKPCVHLAEHLELKDSPIAGLGLFTKKNITKGEKIMDYVGLFFPGTPPSWEFR